MHQNSTLHRLTALILTLVFSAAFLPAETFPQKKGEESSPQTIFSNTAPITINTNPAITAPTVAQPYPSTINVSGMSGAITRVAVSLRGLTHSETTHMDFLLVGPTGAKYMFLSDSLLTAEDGVFTFADDGATLLHPYSPGIYKPVSGDTQADTFPAPAPAAPYQQPPSATFASVFNGTDPNGTWSLYIVDDSLGRSGSVNSGWNITITTSGAPQTFSNSNYIELPDTVRRATPYGSPINVSEQTGVISNLKVTLNGFSHTSASGASVLLVSPNGKGLVLMSIFGVANITANNANLTFDDAAPSTIPLNASIPSGVYKPTDNFSEMEIFPSPAPLRPYNSENFNQLSNFKGFSPNGTWMLYVIDQGNRVASGSIAGGWSLDITTAPPPQQPPVGCASASFNPSTFSVGTNPTGLAVGDFNNDLKPDLAVANQVSNNVSILLGSGNGDFLPQMQINAGSGPYAVAVGFFNSDMNQDLAVVNSGSNNVSILFGAGDGTFSAPTNFMVGASPISIATGDVNNDGRTDLAVANFGGFIYGTVSILLNNGSGGFNAPISIRTRTQPSAVALENLNGDANLDLIVTSFGANTVSTFFGTGSGTFQLSQNLTTGGGPVAINLSDRTRDGIKDLSVANYNSDSVSTFIGTANGVFSGSAGTQNVGSNPISLISANVLGGSDENLVVALSGSNRVNVSLLSEFNVGSIPNAVVSGDFNRDGKTDLATANAGSNDITILRNVCSSATGNLFDFNRDRRTDFAVYRPLNGFWAVQSVGGTPRIFGRDTDKIVPADYDGDLDSDYAIYRPENGLWIVQANSAFQSTTDFGTLYFLQFGLPTDIPVPADYDGDRKTDIAVWRPTNGTFYVRRSSDNSVQSFQFGAQGDKPVPADYDGDNKADFAVFRPSNGVWYIIRSSDGQFAATQFGISTDQTVPNDYDGDGKTDIAVYRSGVWYYLKSSNGDFTVVNFGTTGDIPIAGDYDADGKFDTAIYRPGEGNWYILRSSDGALQITRYGLSIDTPLPSAFVR